MSEPTAESDTTGSEQAKADEQPKKGRLKRRLLSIAMRYGLLRRGIGIQVVYRNTGGGLIVGGLAYAALFALIPTFALIISGIYLLIDDPLLRRDAVDVIASAFPAFEGITQTAVASAGNFAAAGSVVALIGFGWGASGLYLNLTRGMERFFPGERVSGTLARIVGVLLVLLVILGVLAAVFVAGVLTVVANALDVDTEWLLAAAGAAVTLALATGLTYGIYRVVPANPPSPHAARLPAVLVGLAIAAMTLFYSFIAPWLVSGFQMFGVMASVFVALIWLRVVFLAMVYGAAMARYRDYMVIATERGEAEPDSIATAYAMTEEVDRAGQDMVSPRDPAPEDVAAESERDA